MDKKYFPGGNSGKGFFNCFDGIKAADENDFRTIVLKGGPGVGKNTLMKKVAKEAKSRGFDVSLFYCSGDPDSLDAIKIKEKKVILVDGTAPHIIDPVFPGVDDEIVNLGVHISQRICERRDELKAFFAKNSYEYTRCYSYLATALVLVKSNRQAFAEKADTELIDKKIEDILTPSYKNGRVRKLFLSAITCKGEGDFKDTVAGERKYFISGDAGQIFMERVMHALGDRDLEVFPDPLDTASIAHIYVPKEDIWFTTFDIGNAKKIDGDEFLKGEKEEYVTFNKAQVRTLKEKAISHLKNCKAAHDEIEKIYYQYMDFEGVNREHESVLNKIFS